VHAAHREQEKTQREADQHGHVSERATAAFGADHAQRHLRQMVGRPCRRDVLQELRHELQRPPETGKERHGQEDEIDDGGRGLARHP
jgi:hypothetical protein